MLSKSQEDELRGVLPKYGIRYPQQSVPFLRELDEHPDRKLRKRRMTQIEGLHQKAVEFLKTIQSGKDRLLYEAARSTETRCVVTAEHKLLGYRDRIEKLTGVRTMSLAEALGPGPASRPEA